MMSQWYHWFAVGFVCGLVVLRVGQWLARLAIERNYMRHEIEELRGTLARRAGRASETDARR